MKSAMPPRVLVVLCAVIALSAAKAGEFLAKAEITKMLEQLKVKTSPAIYELIHYPNDWKKPMEGLKSVTVEAIAENAHARMSKGLTLEVIGDPIVDGEAAAVLLKRSGGGLDEIQFPAFLYRDKAGRWGFLGFQIPFNRPKIDGLPIGEDDKFMEAALNDPTPYDGVLYEFDDATKKKFEALERKLEASRKASK